MCARISSKIVASQVRDPVRRLDDVLSFEQGYQRYIERAAAQIVDQQTAPSLLPAILTGAVIAELFDRRSDGSFTTPSTLNPALCAASSVKKR